LILKNKTRRLQMKLTQTKTNENGSSLPVYSNLTIPVTEIKALRYALYDNKPAPTHFYEDGRYKAELQIWTEDTDKCQFILRNYLKPYKSYRNNLYKKQDDPYKDWYASEANKAKDLAMTFGTDNLVLHTNLGFQARHEAHDNQYCFRIQPEYAMHVMINDDKLVMQSSIHNFDLPTEITYYKEKAGYDIYYQYTPVEH